MRHCLPVPISHWRDVIHYRSTHDASRYHLWLVDVTALVIVRPIAGLHCNNVLLIGKTSAHSITPTVASNKNDIDEYCWPIKSAWLEWRHQRISMTNRRPLIRMTSSIHISPTNSRPLIAMTSLWFEWRHRPRRHGPIACLWSEWRHHWICSSNITWTVVHTRLQ